ncbi:MAG TPA: hypothetical protein VG742_15550, partial [Dongiaceae bacterium]|nr:hypothetical protein [Dongiaceae bacterium]
MLSAAPKLRYCILAYYVGLFLFGAVSAFFVRDMETALRTFWMDGLSFGLLPHALFFIALKSPGGWLDYSVVFGMSALMVLAAL